MNNVSTPNLESHSRTALDVWRAPSAPPVARSAPLACDSLASRQQGRDPTVAIPPVFAGQRNDVGGQSRLVVCHPGRVSLGASHLSRTRHARRSETVSTWQTCPTAWRRRVGLRSFPGRFPSGSRCPEPGRRPASSTVGFPDRALSGDGLDRFPCRRAVVGLFADTQLTDVVLLLFNIIVALGLWLRRPWAVVGAAFVFMLVSC